jgi:acyl carrier protein
VDRSEVFAVMRDKAVEMLEVPAEDVVETASFVDDLKVDSLSLVEYTMDLEDELGIELPEEELADLKTIGAFLDVVAAKVAAKP